MGNIRMNQVCVVADNIVSPLGFSSEENFTNISNGNSGLHPIELISDNSITFASCFNENQLDKLGNNCYSEVFTRFEKLLYYSIKSTLSKKIIDISSEKTIFIFATTKGNIELIGNPDINQEKLNLFNSAKKITRLFGNSNRPIVISNACISGVAAIIIAQRLLKGGFYENAVISGADTVNDFVLLGFQSLKALSPDQCKPFDRDRNGVNLGEAGATLILTVSDSNIPPNNKISISGGATTNDANHISGPSRTGIELALAIKQALDEASVPASEIDYVSAHGTATEYNDEMEAKALLISSLNNILTNSLKGYYGHTLGVAGLLETIISVHSLKNNLIIQSKGFNNCGTSVSLNICKQNMQKEIRHCIKISSGFGGCNAALVISKN